MLKIVDYKSIAIGFINSINSLIKPLDCTCFNFHL
jgi:hypothetical protein